MGNRNTLMMAWKPCVESIRQAIKPDRVTRYDKHQQERPQSRTLLEILQTSDLAGSVPEKDDPCNMAIVYRGLCQAPSNGISL